MKHLTMMLVITALLSACEYIPFSYGALEGTVVETPADWSAVAATEIIQFETNPDDPYSVNLWVVEIDGDLFVYAGENRATWVEHIENDNRVRLAANGSIFELEAERVTDQALFDRFAEKWKSKYGNYPRSRIAADTWLMRLTPRNDQT